MMDEENDTDQTARYDMDYAEFLRWQIKHYQKMIDDAKRELYRIELIDCDEG